MAISQKYHTITKTLKRCGLKQKQRNKALKIFSHSNGSSNLEIQGIIHKTLFMWTKRHNL